MWFFSKFKWWKYFIFQYETTIISQDQLNPFIPTIFIGWVNDNQFILLFPKDFPTNLIENINILNLSPKLNKNVNRSMKNEISSNQ